MPRISKEPSAARLRATRMPNASVFFLIALILGFLGSSFYFAVVLQLLRKGIRVKFLATPTDSVGVLRRFRVLAKENSWSLWPYYGFWLTLVFFFTSAAALIATDCCSPLPGGATRLRALTTSSALAWWWLCSNLLIGIVFSYRALRGFSAGHGTLSSWRSWISDQYIRNDLALAILGWVGAMVTFLWQRTRL